MKFTRIIKAAKAAEVNIWQMADALLKEATEKDTGSNGLKAVAAELENRGFDYTVPYLRVLRQTAASFPPNRRHADVSLRVHSSVRSPDVLDAVVKGLRKQGKTPSLHHVDRIITVMRKNEMARLDKERQEAEREEAEARAAEQQARHREINAKTDDEKTKARRERETHRKRKEEAGERADRATTINRADLQPPREEEFGELIVLASVRARASCALNDAAKADEILKKSTELSATGVAVMTDTVLSVANAWRDVASTIKTRLGRVKTPTLSVVNQ